VVKENLIMRYYVLSLKSQVDMDLTRIGLGFYDRILYYQKYLQLRENFKKFRRRLKRGYKAGNKVKFDGGKTF